MGCASFGLPTEVTKWGEVVPTPVAAVVALMLVLVAVLVQMLPFQPCGSAATMVHVY
jgi:hypothetical protein